MWKCSTYSLETKRTLTMGIVNVTPDSFSDGGMYLHPDQAFSRARNCVREGADIIDVGAESTRPDSTPITWEMEWKRLEPALAKILTLKVPVSIDTYHPETAERAIALGAAIVNCVYTPDRRIVELARSSGCGLIAPLRHDEGAELDAFNEMRSGIEEQVMGDPEIGFGTTREEDLALLGSLRRLASVAPICVGVSRKRLIKKLTGVKGATGKDVGGSVGAAVWCAMNGASVVRVHDVAETARALKVVEALAWN